LLLQYIDNIDNNFKF